MPDVKSLVFLPSSWDHVMVYLNAHNQEKADLKKSQIQGDWWKGE